MDEAYQDWLDQLPPVQMPQGGGLFVYSEFLNEIVFIAPLAETEIVYEPFAGPFEFDCWG